MILLIIPTQQELDLILSHARFLKLQAVEQTIGRLPATRLPEMNTVISLGGLGKVQMGVQTQHLLDACTEIDNVICAGAAGGLLEEVQIGDLVIGIETVEHDIRKLGRRMVPRFCSSEPLLADFRSLTPTLNGAKIHFGPIASGDEDIMDSARRQALHEATGALAVAWEGAGAGRACKFSGVPFAEVRAVVDQADKDAAADFHRNLENAMRNVLVLISALGRTRLTSRCTQFREAGASPHE